MAKNSPDEVAHQSSHQEWPNVSFCFKKFSDLVHRKLSKNLLVYPILYV